MSYTDFTLDLVLVRFGLSLNHERLFSNVEPLEPSDWLLKLLDLGRINARLNEKSRSELLIAPILLRCQQLLAPNGSFYSGVSLEVDPSLGLGGECDFILNAQPPAEVLRSPLCVVLEAKKGDIGEGIAQCTAQMVALRLFNRARKQAGDLVYGCVSTGDIWRFLKLHGHQLTADVDLYYLSDLGTILGILVTAVRDAARSVASAEANPR